MQTTVLDINRVTLDLPLAQQIEICPITLY